MPSRVHRVRVKKTKKGAETQVAHKMTLHEWCAVNQQQLLGAAMAVVVAVLILVIYVSVTGRSEDRALELLEAARQVENPETRISNFADIVDSHSRTTAAYEATFLLGNAYYEAEKYEDAKETFEKLLKKYSKSYFAPMAEEGLAYVAEAQGDMPAAIEHFKRVTEKYPGTIVAHRAFMDLGRIYESNDDADLAAQAYDDLVSRYPGSAYADEAAEKYKKLKPPESPAVSEDTSAE